MSYSSELTKERILHSAKEEFLNKGFMASNLREIAKNAKVTTGALYNHYKSKEDLFEVIVGDFAQEVLLLFTKLHEEVGDNYDFDSAETTEDMGKGTFAVLDLLYNNFKLSKLLFSCSTGTKYENFVDKMIEVEERSSIKAVERDNFKLDKINRFFIHVMSTSGITNMLEAIHHDLTREEAFEYIAKVQRFYYAGTKEILGQ